MPQKEETFQVVICIIKNKAFTISADFPEIFKQQFWYTIKKVHDTKSYEFFLANKKYTINAEVFWTILNIYPRVEGVDFTDAPDNETTLTFLIDLGYKGPLNRHTNMFVDHMHQPWRTLAAIINKCLSGKIASNDKLRKSRINILRGMFNRENVDYPDLIWEDFAYQIDNRKEKRSRRENMPYPRFTKIIINHFLKQHKSLTNLNHKQYHTIKDDRNVSRLEFVRISKDYQVYGLPIPDVIQTDAIKHSKSYQMFIKYSINQIPHKKIRGKGSKGKKTVDESQEIVDRIVKKKVTLSADDNIISHDPDAALELAKSISQTEAEEAEAARKVHATHARIVTKFVPESAKKKSGGRSSKSVVIQDTLTLKESKKTSRRQPGTEGSNEGTDSKPGVPDESTVVFATSKKVILESGDEQDSEFSDDDNDDVDKDDKDGDADDEGDDHVSDTQDADDEDVETESDEDEIYKYKIREEKVTDAAKEEAEKTLEAKDDTKKSELPPSSSILSVSSGFGDQFLKLSSDFSLVSTVKDSVDTDVSSLLDIPIQHETPQTQSPSVQKIPVSVIPETTNLPPILEIITETPVLTVVPSPQVTPIFSSIQQTPTLIPTQPITTDAPTITSAILEFDALSTVELRVSKLKKDVSELKTVDHSSEVLDILQSHVPTVVDSYLDTKVEDVFQKELQKHTTYLIHKYSLQHLPELTKKPTLTAEQ
ncbi:hypothetical protein Tco_0500706 [Tanacetum coccineum]